jgi:hypothetical protein
MDIIKNGTKHVLFPYQFRPLQQEFLKNKGRFSILVAHRRFGKTTGLLLDMVLQSLNTKKRNPRFWYIFPQATQAKSIAWNELKRMASFIPGIKISEAHLEVSFDLNDGFGLRSIALKGVDKGGDNLRGAYLDGVVLDEMKDMPMGVWEQVLVPMLADRKGWAVLTGTVGQGAWHDLFVRESNDPQSVFKVFLYKASETKIVDAEELELQRKIMGINRYNREYECDWNAIEEGSYYGDILSGLEQLGHVNLDVRHNPQKPVYTSWDLGAADATAVWFFQEGTEEGTWNVIDYLELTRVSLQENNESVGSIAFDRVVFNKVVQKPYFYAAHVLPHDSVQKHSSADNSTYQKFVGYSGATKVILAKKTNPLDRIATVQQLLGSFRFHKVVCSKGLAALHSYRAKLTPDGTEVAPNHNWASHGADSFGYFCHSLPLLKGVRNKFNGVSSTNKKKSESYNPFK